MHKEYQILIAYLVCMFVLLFAYFIMPSKSETHTDYFIEAQNEYNRIHIIERGAEDDATELALTEHQEVNYVRCFLRPAGYVTCQVHTPPADVEAQCSPRGSRQFLVDRNRCHWTNPASMAHP